MGLRDDLLRVPLERRFTYHPKENLFFVNFEGHRVRNHEDVERIRRTVESMLSPLGRKVYVIVNYDNFEILPDIVDEYSVMVRDLVDRFYSGVTRYTTSGFLAHQVGRGRRHRSSSRHTSTKALKRPARTFANWKGSARVKVARKTILMKKPAKSNDTTCRLSEGFR